MNPNSTILQSLGIAAITAGIIEAGLAVRSIYAVVGGIIVLLAAAVLEASENND